MKVAFYLARPDITTVVNGKLQTTPNPNPTVIFCRISYDGYRLKYMTPENIIPKFWNGKAKPHRAKETTKFPEHPEFNKRLDNIEAAIKTTIRKYINDHDNKPPVPAILKPLLDIAIRNGGNVQRETLLTFFDRFITECKAGIKTGKHGKPITAGTIKSYVTTKAIVTDYQTSTHKDLSFESIDMVFFNDFTKYLTLVKKQSTNYIHKNFKVIKTVLQYATDLKINTNIDFKSSNFSAPTEQTDSIYLPESELKEIAELDLSNELSLDRVRDLFLVGCYTGLRYSDLSTLTPGQINNGMITITQIKTSKPVVIPVHSNVSRILFKYGGSLPKALTNQKMNDNLKLVAGKCKSLKRLHSISYTKGGKTVTETLQRSEFVTCHTSRRSFASNLYLQGIPTITIMAVTGHKTESAFMKYIRIPQDEQAKIMAGIWSEKKTEKTKKIAI
jgi:integrase